MSQTSSIDPGVEPASCCSSAEARLSECGVQVLPGSFQRRWRQPGVTPPDRASITPAMRKKYLKELLLSGPGHSGLSRVLSSPSTCAPAEEQDVDWALYPMEHAWMLSAVEGSFETILDFIIEDPQLLTRRDFISGYSVLHWMAKQGRGETLIRVLRYAQRAGIPVNINLRGSGGLTPLHVATMHGHFMVIKLLVGAFGADVDAMDHSGRRAWQYLRTDAPPELKELLGTWDLQTHGNANNNSVVSAGPCGDGLGKQAEETDYFDRTRRVGSWKFGSLRKLVPSFSFYGSKTS